MAKRQVALNKAMENFSDWPNGSFRPLMRRDHGGVDETDCVLLNDNDITTAGCANTV